MCRSLILIPALDALFLLLGCPFHSRCDGFILFCHDWLLSLGNLFSSKDRKGDGRLVKLGGVGETAGKIYEKRIYFQ